MLTDFLICGLVILECFVVLCNKNNSNDFKIKYTMLSVINWSHVNLILFFATLPDIDIQMPLMVMPPKTNSQTQTGTDRQIV